MPTRIIAELEKAASDVRKAQKKLLDALVHAVMENNKQLRNVDGPRPGLEGLRTMLLNVGADAKKKYENKAKRTRESMRRIEDKRAEVRQQRDAVKAERDGAREGYAQRITQLEQDNDAKIKQVQELLAAILRNEEDVRKLTKEDKQSEWGFQIVDGTLQANDQTLVACLGEIERYPPVFDRSAEVAEHLGNTCANFVSGVHENGAKHLRREEQHGRQLDTRHFLEYVDARKDVHRQKLNADINHYAKQEQVERIEIELEEAQDAGDQVEYNDLLAKRGKVQEQVTDWAQKRDDPTDGLIAETNYLDQLIRPCLDRLKPCYESPTAEDAELKQAIAEKLAADRITKQPWNQGGVLFGRGSAWALEHPAACLEPVVLKVVAKGLDKRHKRSKRLMEEMEGRRERFTAEIMRTLEDAPPAA